MVPAARSWDERPAYKVEFRGQIGYGMMAHRGIVPGELILEEAPLLIFKGDYEKPEGVKALDAAFQALPKDQQAKVMALDDAFTRARGHRKRKTLPGILSTNGVVGDDGEGLLCDLVSRFKPFVQAKLRTQLGRGGGRRSGFR